MFCPNCGYQIQDNSVFCMFCGNKIQYQNTQQLITPMYSMPPQPQYSSQQPPKPTFNGIYKYTLFGGKQEVYCPRCNSSNCSYFTEEKFIPGKTKTSYSANLNPLKPLTFVNKKEKVKRKDMTINVQHIQCNDCGKTFD